MARGAGGAMRPAQVRIPIGRRSFYETKWYRAARRRPDDERDRERDVLVLVALVAASALAAVSVRSMAVAFTRTVDARSVPMDVGTRERRKPRGYLAYGETAVLVFDILMSLGIALLIVGLAAAAALPARLMAGALLAQVAVLCSLVAPQISLSVGRVQVRPVAIALGIAQLANVVFFVRAIQALI